MSDRQDRYLRLALVIFCLVLVLWTAYAGCVSTGSIVGR